MSEIIDYENLPNGKFPFEQQLINDCKHCVDAVGLWIDCDLGGEITEHYNIVCENCSAKEPRK